MICRTLVRPAAMNDLAGWLRLWDLYIAFYGRAGESALPEHITQTTWERFFDETEDVFALVAEQHGQLIGLAHYLLHRSTSRVEMVCYLSDLFTEPSMRGQGVGRALIQAVCDQALASGVKRVYWQTHESNSAGRLLYEKLARHHGFIVYSCDM